MGSETGRTVHIEQEKKHNQLTHENPWDLTQGLPPLLPLTFLAHRGMPPPFAQRILDDSHLMDDDHVLGKPDAFQSGDPLPGPATDSGHGLARVSSRCWTGIQNRLEEADLIETEKTIHYKRTLTTAALSRRSRHALDLYWQSMEALRARSVRTAASPA